MVRMVRFTCEDRLTAILRTIGGVFLPKDAGTDFWMFPTVKPPYLKNEDEVNQTLKYFNK